MIRLSVVALSLLTTFSAFASFDQSAIFELQVGEKLIGTDVVSKKECSVEILNRKNEGRHLQMTLGLSVGETRYQAFDVDYRFVLTRATMFKELSKEINNKEWNTVTVDATLQEHRITGQRSFYLTRTVWRNGSYSPVKVINCQF